MSSRLYQDRCRFLRKTYTDETGYQISDVTWYRLIASAKKYLGLEVYREESTLIIKTLGQIKKHYRNLRLGDQPFRQSWEIFQEYRKMDCQMKCSDFVISLEKRLNLESVSRTTRYNWFASSGVPYRASKEYSTKDLALVALRASKSVYSKQKGIKIMSAP